MVLIHHQLGSLDLLEDTACTEKYRISVLLRVRYKLLVKVGMYSFVLVSILEECAETKHLEACYGDEGNSSSSNSDDLEV